MQVTIANQLFSVADFHEIVLISGSCKLLPVLGLCFRSLTVCICYRKMDVFASSSYTPLSLVFEGLSCESCIPKLYVKEIIPGQNARLF